MSIDLLIIELNESVITKYLSNLKLLELSRDAQQYCHRMCSVGGIFFVFNRKLFWKKYEMSVVFVLLCTREID